MIAALDFEFTWAKGARPWDYRKVEPVCAVLRIDNKEVRACPMLDAPFSILEPYLADENLTIFAHHMHAELSVIKALKLPIPINFCDTETAARYLEIRDEGFLRFDHSLLACLRRAGLPARESWLKEKYRQMVINRDFSDIRGIVDYCAHDVRDTLALARLQAPRLDKHFWSLIQPLQHRLLALYDYGLHVDIESYSQLQENGGELLRRQQRRLHDLGFQGQFEEFEKLTSLRHNIDVQRTLMVTGLDDVLDELPIFKRDADKLGWQRRSMSNLFKSNHHRHEFLRAVGDYHSLIDLLRYDWRQFIDSDYRVRFGHTFPGTSSYRISPRMPHPLQLSKTFRPVLTASPGNALVEIDYSCQEVGLAGSWYQDPKLLRLFNDFRLDLYSEIGHAMGLYPSDDPDTDPELRDQLKTAILAIMYGGGKNALRENLQISEAEAEKIVRAFRNTFPNLFVHRAQYLEICRIQDFALNRIKLRRHYERVRLLDSGPVLTDLSFMNFPIQSGGAAVMARVLWEMPDWIKIVATCHDAILIECEQAAVNDVIVTASNVMKHANDALFPDSRCRVKPQAAFRYFKSGPDSLHKFCSSLGLPLSSPVGWRAQIVKA